MRKASGQEPDGFAEYWAAWMPYRRKNDGRGEARICYRKHILAGAEPADIIDGARGYLRSLTAAEKPYIPLAATWLNREAYLDWCDQERAYQKRLAERQEAAVAEIKAKAVLPENHFSRRWERGEIKAGE
jgi:hypothetical protein